MFRPTKQKRFPTLLFISGSIFALILFGILITTFKVVVASSAETDQVTSPATFHDCTADPYVTCTQD